MQVRYNRTPCSTHIIRPSGPVRNSKMTVSPLTLEIPADLYQLTVVRQFVAEKAASLGAEPGAVDDLVLAVDEIVTNSICHGYRGEAGIVEIELRADGDSLEVSVRDSATLFDPTLVPPPDLSMPLLLRPPGGMGLYLARELTDAITYRRTADGRNEVKLVKRVH
jgi:serine/threonine-protein kinase RsbW